MKKEEKQAAKRLNNRGTLHLFRTKMKYISFYDFSGERLGFYLNYITHYSLLHKISLTQKFRSICRSESRFLVHTNNSFSPKTEIRHFDLGELNYMLSFSDYGHLEANWIAKKNGGATKIFKCAADHKCKDCSTAEKKYLSCVRCKNPQFYLSVTDQCCVVSPDRKWENS